MTKSILLSHILFVDIVSWPYGFPHWNKIYFKINAEKNLSICFRCLLFCDCDTPKVLTEELVFLARSFFLCPFWSCQWLWDYQHNRSKVLSLFHRERSHKVGEKWQPIKRISFYFVVQKNFMPFGLLLHRMK